jgi:group I intron endonuclease
MSHLFSLPNLTHQNHSRLHPDVKDGGIYYFKNKTNLKYYVGSSIDLRHRIYAHLSMLRRGLHVNKHLQSAWFLYSEYNFEIGIIENCTKEIIVEREQYWINTLEAFKNGYNKRPIAESNIGLIYTEERKVLLKLRLSDPITKEKMRIAKLGTKQSEEQKVKRSISRIGYVNSKEAIENMKIAAKRRYKNRIYTEEERKLLGSYRKGKKMSDEAKRKISEAGRNRAPISDETREKLRNAAKRRCPELQKQMLTNMLAARGVKI